MKALTLLLPALIVGLPAQVQPQGKDPAVAAADLRQTLSSRDDAATVAAIERHGLVADAAVVKLLGKALSHNEEEVRLTALTALRRNAEPSTVMALLSASRSRKLLDSDATAEAYYMALGQKADPRALRVLTKGLHVERGSRVVRARILAIGRIRDPKSVPELMALLKSSGGKRGRGGNPHMRDLQVALVALTGHDAGKDESEWIEWWKDNKSGYRLPEKAPELPRQVQRKWDSLWGEPKRDGKKDEKKKRGDGAKSPSRDAR